MLEVTVEGERKSFDADRCINAGYTGRDEEAVQAHVEELEEDGIEGPDRVPTSYPLAPYTVLVDPGAVQVIGGDTSGEAEFALLLAGDEWYVAAASDQTDRALEAESIPLAKQVAPNVLSGRAWRYSSVEDHWDDLELRSWTTVDGERMRYQEATLGSILTPGSLVEVIEERYGGPLPGTVLLSGTVATESGEIRPGSRFEVELADPVLDRSLSVAYDVDPLPET